MLFRSPQRNLFKRRAIRLYREFKSLENILLCNLRAQVVNPKEIKYVIQKWRKLSSKADAFLLDTLDQSKIDSLAGKIYRHKIWPLSIAIGATASALQQTKPSKLTSELKMSVTAMNRPSTANHKPQIR